MLQVVVVAAEVGLQEGSQPAPCWGRLARRCFWRQRRCLCVQRRAFSAGASDQHWSRMHDLHVCLGSVMAA